MSLSVIPLHVAVQGENRTVICTDTAQSYPPPEIYLSHSGSLGTVYKSVNHSLVYDLNNIQPHFGGIWACGAKNEVGRAQEVNTSITVHCEYTSLLCHSFPLNLAILDRHFFEKKYGFHYSQYQCLDWGDEMRILKHGSSKPCKILAPDPGPQNPKKLCYHCCLQIAFHQNQRHPLFLFRVNIKIIRLGKIWNFTDILTRRFCDNI